MTLPKILEYLDFKIYIKALDNLRMNRKFFGDAKEGLSWPLLFILMQVKQKSSVS